jgi:hypothetical protein
MCTPLFFFVFSNATLLHVDWQVQHHLNDNEAAYYGILHLHELFRTPAARSSRTFGHMIPEEYQQTGSLS